MIKKEMTKEQRRELNRFLYGDGELPKDFFIIEEKGESTKCVHYLFDSSYKLGVGPKKIENLLKEEIDKPIVGAIVAYSVNRYLRHLGVVAEDKNGIIYVISKWDNLVLKHPLHQVPGIMGNEIRFYKNPKNYPTIHQ